MKETVTEELTIRGMFCEHCESRVEQTLLALPGVSEVKASLAGGTARIRYQPELSGKAAFREALAEEGYTLGDPRERTVQLVSVLVILLALYLIAQHLGWLRIFRIFPAIGEEMSYPALFFIGLLTSVHCIAMCGGINLTQSALSAEGDAKPHLFGLAYNGGRLLSYTVIGGIVGGIGQLLSFSGAAHGIVAILAGAAMLLMALRMLGLGKWLPRLRLRLPDRFYQGAAKRMVGGSSFVIGLLNGLMPCGPLQSMQLYALASGSVLRGLLSMLCFGLGTAPLMYGFGFAAGKLQQRYRSVMLTVSALLIFVMGLQMLGNGLSLSGAALPTARSAEQGITAELDGGIQRVRTTVDYGSYEAFTVRAGVPVQWTIYVPEGRLNGCNGEILVPAYGLDIRLSEGENVVLFTPEEAGSVPYSCWMGMIRSSIRVVEG